MPTPTPPNRQPTSISTKVSAAAFAAAATTIISELVQQLSGAALDPAIQGALTTVLVFLAGYLVRDNA